MKKMNLAPINLLAKPRNVCAIFFVSLLLTACAAAPSKPEIVAPTMVPPPVVTTTVVRNQPKIALVLGGGGARGFAHVGVIKALEAQGISPDIIVGTSVGSAVGALYAAGFNGYQLQEISIPMQRDSVSDWALPNLGFLSGEPLEIFINKMLKHKPMEQLRRTFAAVATDLRTGEEVVFRTGNTGQAVRASCAVPGIFQPVLIQGKSYVDGGLVKPVPISVARAMGADIVIAVDISNLPENNPTASTLDVLMQTFDIMSRSINRYELLKADIVISPVTKAISQTTLDDKHWAILEGEKAATAAMPKIKAKIQGWN
jgi:NTE family protein